jgi:hypothetical protein
MRISLKRIVLGAAITIPVVAGFSVLPASAAPRATVRLVPVTAGPAISSIPRAKIVGEGKTAVYSPKSLSVPEDTTGGDCTNDGFTSFKILNKGTATAYVILDGQTFFPLAGGATAGICIDGGQAGDQETFGLSNKKGTKDYETTLLITFSS